ncbi:MAG: DUF2956 domain-containing protein [Kangiellaceae bacterium]|nr:DUF2956 domain-containing protein [Kangiellaceae bacterium]
MKKNKNKPSKETVAEALKVAKATQKPGQTKEQTKLIAQGIQKGIEQYKKQQKTKARELDKRLKNARKQNNEQAEPEVILSESNSINYLPWGLLAISWLGFLLYSFVLN